KYGQLGDGTYFTDRYTPVTVQGISNVIAIATGEEHTCAVFSDKTVKCWGYNGFGQLGDGADISKSTPVTVVNLNLFK
ncbi:MAG: hypothetical protein ACP5G1_02615, partial [Nanopusillaceae archaeon]